MREQVEEAIADYVVALNYNDLPSQVVEITKRQFLDFFAVSIAGHNAPAVKELRELYESMEGRPESTVIGSPRKLPALDAAQVNATMAHALDFDDVHEYAIMHPGVITITPALAIAEKIGGISGKVLISSVALGVDLACRFALAPTPGRKPHVGWHLTSLFGYLVSAAVAAKLFGFKREQVMHAMGIAYHQAAGNGQSVKDGALTKRLGPGFAVRGGILSALLAGKGVTGACRFLTGEWGLYNLYFKGDYKPEVLVKGLGISFLNTGVVFKPYPCCRGVHPAIDAALKIVRDLPNLDLGDIEKVTLEVSESHYHLLCSPEETKCFPRNTVDAQFSIPWGVAVALSKKRVTLDYFMEQSLKDQEILSISSKMAIKVNPKLNRRTDESIEPTIVTISMKDGKSYSAIEEQPLGSTTHPMTWKDCIRKFNDCLNGAFHLDANRLVRDVDRLEHLSDVSVLVKPLAYLPRA
ncbi:MAG: MmgE/PrpD family protein [Candidatus Bathyarchaeia archaeon]